MIDDSSTIMLRTSRTVTPITRSIASSRVRSRISAVSVFTIPRIATMIAMARSAYVITKVWSKIRMTSVRISRLVTVKA